MHLLARNAQQAPGIPLFETLISSSLLDRIDITIEVPRVEYGKLSDTRLGESSEAVQRRVEAAREIKRRRFGEARQGGENSSQAPPQASPLQVLCNADMHLAEVRKFSALDETGLNLMRPAMQQLQLSARAYHRVLKLARTIANLAGVEQLQPAHLAEALQYKPRMEIG